MQIPIFIAKVLGLAYLVFGLGVLLNEKYYRRFLDDLIKDRADLFWTGAFALLVGFLIVFFHNAWQAQWYLLITIFGWLALLKGVFIIVFPEAMADLIKMMTKSKNFLHYWGVVIVVIGAIFGYFGYVA